MSDDPFVSGSIIVITAKILFLFFMTCFCVNGIFY